MFGNRQHRRNRTLDNETRGFGNFDRVFNIRNRSNVLLSDSAAYPTITYNDVIVSLERRCTSLTVKLDELEVAAASQRETFIQ